MTEGILHTPYYEARKTFVGRAALMPDVIVSSTRQGLERGTAQIEERTKSFQDKYLAKNPEKAKDGSVTSFFDDMNHVGFWHILGRIDGYPSADGTEQGKVNAIASKKAREWAGSNFSIEELTEILGICVDTALLGVYSDRGQPGFKKGHSIIYSHLAEKKDSIFAGMASKPLLKRLQNGRFWEELPDLGRYRDKSSLTVGDVLTNHFEDLDSNFFEQGYAIFQRNQGEFLERGASLESLSILETQRYLEFVEKLDEKLDNHRKNDAQIPWMGRQILPVLEPSPIDARIGYLLVPYVHDIHDPLNLHRGRNNAQSMPERFENPLVQRYLEHSNVVRSHLAQDLLNYSIVNKTDDPLSKDVTYAATILTHMPKPRDMLDQIVGLARNELYPERHFKGVNKLFKLAGLTLSDYLSENDPKLKAKI